MAAGERTIVVSTASENGPRFDDGLREGLYRIVYAGGVPIYSSLEEKTVSGELHAGADVTVIATHTDDTKVFGKVGGPQIGWITMCVGMLRYARRLEQLRVHIRHGSAGIKAVQETYDPAPREMLELGCSDTSGRLRCVLDVSANSTWLRVLDKVMHEMDSRYIRLLLPDGAPFALSVDFAVREILAKTVVLHALDGPRVDGVLQVSCTQPLGGDELAVLEVHSAASMRELRARLDEQVGGWLWTFLDQGGAEIDSHVSVSEGIRGPSNMRKNDA